MASSTTPGDGSSPSATGTASRVAAGLLALVGAAHGALGVGAIAGLDTFVANVEKIERTVSAGLIASLAAWGWVMLLLGIAELIAARSLWSGSPNGRLAGQLTAFLGLGGAFFTLAIFRLAGAVTIVLGLAAIYLLNYRVGRAGAGRSSRRI